MKQRSFAFSWGGFLGLALMGASSLSAVACGDDSAAGGAGGTGSATNATSATVSGATTTTGTQATGASTGSSQEAPTISLMITPTTMAAGDTVDGTINVTNYTLEGPHGQGNQPGHGHYHIYLDNAGGTDYLIASPAAAAGVVGQTDSISITIPPGTAPGPHTLKASLGQNNHAPLSPKVESIVDITVQ